MYLCCSVIYEEFPLSLGEKKKRKEKRKYQTPDITNIPPPQHRLHHRTHGNAANDQASESQAYVTT